jgi:magnesium transporter
VVVGLLDLHLFNLNNRMNEVMKILALFTSIFIPLTFIAGVYGMNFHHMPELDLPWAYPALWAVMVAIGVGMVFFFRRKKWL